MRAQLREVGGRETGREKPALRTLQEIRCHTGTIGLQQLYFAATKLQHDAPCRQRTHPILTNGHGTQQPLVGCLRGNAVGYDDLNAIDTVEHRFKSYVPQRLSSGPQTDAICPALPANGFSMSTGQPPPDPRLRKAGEPGTDIS